MSIRVDDRDLVLSHVQARPLLNARASGAATAESTTDLGMTAMTVDLASDGVTFPGYGTVAWTDLARIAENQTKCYLLRGGELDEIRVFSETTGWVRSLYPTSGAPTMLASGIAMHRIQGIDPWEDTLRKIKAAAPVAGRVLDTATGLGYTAIVATRTAVEVVTIELDPAALEVAALNPWSRPLFENPKITQIVGDAVEEIARFPDGCFSVIIHDPPALSLAGDLYSGAFYRELRRVLARRGRLFHYIGDPESPSSRNTTRGVIRRLQDAGFSRVVRRPEAFGVVAE